MHFMPASFLLFFKFLFPFYILLQTNGEKQCKFLVDYMENESKGNFYDVKIVPDFAGIQRFVTGFHH